MLIMFHNLKVLLKIKKTEYDRPRFKSSHILAWNLEQITSYSLSKLQSLKWDGKIIIIKIIIKWGWMMELGRLDDTMSWSLN